MDKEKQISELISISLWSIRRLPTKKLKEYALGELRKTVDNNHIYSDFIDECIEELEIK